MKTKIFNSLVISLLVIFGVKTTSAQDLSALFSGIGAPSVRQVCYTDGFGYVWSITGTSTGGGNWTLSGSVAVTGLGNWAVSGNGNNITKNISITATNPNGDNCQSASDNFTYTGVVSGTSISGSWANDCGLSGTFSGNYVAGTCSAPTASIIRAGAPANSKGDIYSMFATPSVRQVCYTDGFGYVWSITGTSTGGGNWTLSGSVAVTGLGNWAVSGNGNNITKNISITATNPNGDNCQTASDNFTYTGVVSGTSISGSWVNDCGLSGTFSGSYVAGTCAGTVSQIIKYGAPANAKANDISVNPNPVISFATITYSTSKTDVIKVSVVDNFGQVVKVLFSGTLQAGSHSVNWDATNMNGMHVGNGIYTLQVQTSFGTQVHAISVGQ